MPQKSKSSIQNIVLFLTASVSILAFVFISYRICPFLLDNDNIYLKTVVSGEMTGTPEPHMYFISLAGWPLSVLYLITGNSIPWFGLFLCISLSLPLVLVFYECLKKCDSFISGALFYCFFIIMLICFFYQYFAELQFTTASGFAGVAACFVFSMTDLSASRRKFVRSSVLFLLLAAWSFSMRDESFYMLFPFLGMTFLSLLTDSADFSKKKIKDIFTPAAKRLLILSGISALVLFSLILLKKSAYGSEEWKEYTEYEEAQSIMVDYCGIPDYEENRDAYEELGILPSSHEAFSVHNCILLEPNFNRESNIRLAEIAESSYNAKAEPILRHFITVMKEIFDRNILSYTDRPMNIPVYFIYLLTVISAIMLKKKKALRDVAFIIIARMFVWIYLVWFGRFPFRVTQIIYVTELVLLISVILRYDLCQAHIQKFRDKHINIRLYLMISLLCILGIRFGYPIMKGTLQSCRGSYALSANFRELEDYLEQHPDNFYYFDMSHLYYMEEALSTEPSAEENYVYTGGWLANSPWYNNKLRAHGIDDVMYAWINNPNVYIIYQQVDFDDRSFLDRYMDEHFPGYTVECIDTFQSSNGFTYEFLKPEKENL